MPKMIMNKQSCKGWLYYVIHKCNTFILKFLSMLTNESGGIISSGLWDSVILNVNSIVEGKC